MIGDIITEILKGFGYIFLHPLFYIGFLIMVSIGIVRVKRERRDFNTKVYDFLDETIISLFPGIITGMAISIVILGLGIALSFEFLLIITAIYLLLALTNQIRWLAPSYVLSISIMCYLLLSMNELQFTLPLLGELIFTYDPRLLVYGVLLLALLLIGEGFLIRTNGYKNTSPRILKSKRGKFIGAHESKRLWFVPIFFLLPEGLIPSWQYWPVLAIGEQGTYSVILVPFLIGFHQLIRSVMPAPAIRKMAHRVIALGIVVSIVSVASIFYPILVIGVIALAIIGREALSVAHKIKDDGKQSYFIPRERGVMILGIIPRSPAAKLHLNVGEIIIKVNGEIVNNQFQFYNALQKNPAFCKLEVIDEDGEVRFAQTALYDGDYHQLGVLLLKEEFELQSSVV